MLLHEADDPAPLPSDISADAPAKSRTRKNPDRRPCINSSHPNFDARDDGPLTLVWFATKPCAKTKCTSKGRAFMAKLVPDFKSVAAQQGRTNGKWFVRFANGNDEGVTSLVQARSQHEAVGCAYALLARGLSVTGIVGEDGRRLEVDFLPKVNGTRSTASSAPRWLVCFTDVVTGSIAASTRPCSREEAIGYARWLAGEGSVVTAIFDPEGRQLPLLALREGNDLTDAGGAWRRTGDA